MIRDVTDRSEPASGDIQVRPASGLPEIEAAGRVVAAAYVDSGFGDEYYQAVLLDARSRAEQAELLVAVDEAGGVLGTVTYTRAGGELAEVSRPGEAEFRMLGVDPAAQGRGVGEALVLACVARARRDGASAVAICTMDLMQGAQRIYGRLGFVRDPERDWRPRPTVQLLGFVLTL